MSVSQSIPKVSTARPEGQMVNFPLNPEEWPTIPSYVTGLTPGVSCLAQHRGLRARGLFELIHEGEYIWRKGKKKRHHIMAQGMRGLAWAWSPCKIWTVGTFTYLPDVCDVHTYLPLSFY